MTGTIGTADLLEHRFFKEIPLPTLERIAQCAEPLAVAKGAHMLTEGEPANSFYAIQHGRVAVGVHTPHKGLVVIETVQGGDVLGWSWLFPPYRWNFDAVAVAPVQAIRVHADCVRPYLFDNPQAAFDLVTGIAGVMEDRLRSARMRLIDLYGEHDDAVD